jgi:hypothetical protein
MYGVGYDFSPLFTFCTHNVVGALPVGVDSFRDDQPFWCPTANATCKEIWVSPVSRFLGTLANFLSEPSESSSVEAAMKLDGNKVTAEISGSGKHGLELRLFNASSDFSAQEVNLSSGQSVSISFDLAVEDDTMPFVAALIIDGDTENAVMLTGASF